MKKILALLLAAVMVLSMAACSNTSAETEPAAENNTPATEAVPEVTVAEESNVNLEGFPIVNEPITVTMFGQKHAIHGEWENMVFFKEMEEMTGIHFEFDTPLQEVFKEQLSLNFVAEEYAQVLFSCDLSASEIAEYGVSDGYLIPLEDYIDQYCPNITYMLDNTPFLREAITAEDGHIYALPKLSDRAAATCIISWADINWVNAIGYTDADRPTTTDELYTMLTKLQEAGCEYPISLTSDQIYNYFFPAFGLPNTNFYADDNGQVQYALEQTEQAKAALAYIAQLYSEKLLDNESLSQDGAAVTAKGANAEVGISVQALASNTFTYLTQEEAATCWVMPAMSSAYSDSPMVHQTNAGYSTGVFALTDLCDEETAIAMMRWVDYLYSFEGSFLIWQGPEGLCYTVNEDGTYNEIAPTDGRTYEERRGNDITPNCGINTPAWMRSEHIRFLNPESNSREIQVEEYLAEHRRLALPNLSFTEEEQEVISAYSTDLNKYVSEWMAKFVNGMASTDEYETFVEGLADFHLDEIKAVYQSALDRFNGV